MKKAFEPKIVNINDIRAIDSTDQNIKKILIIKPSSLGDIFHAFPAFYLLKRYFPDAEIDWFINISFAPILSYIEKDLNRVILFRRKDFKNWFRAVKTFLNLFFDIRKSKYDLVIDMQGLMRSAIFTFIARSGKKVGFSDVREKISTLAYHNKIDIPEDITHAIDKNIYLVASIFKTDHSVPDYILPVNENINIKRILQSKNIESGDRYITISPGARWTTKTWPPEFFAKISDDITKEHPDIKIVLIGSGAEIKIAKKLTDLCLIAKPVSTVGETSLAELVELIRNSELLLTNDSGPMHIAAFLRVPVFALFGPTYPEKTGPYWEWHKVYQSEKGCIKCLKRDCSVNTLECQKNIEDEKVAQDINNKLSEVLKDR
ncbi:MAG TPA: lipopolysaccharide heptosyltransferase II [Victivallales bacterium]|nr:lipopolysaccharide heptosyltransferase II [Victivallales bacterium]